MAVNAADIRKWVEPLVEKAGAFLYDVRVRKRKPEPVAEVLVDGPGGLSVDQCGELHRAIAAAIEGTCADECLIQVSTPGIDRKCRFPQDFFFYPDKKFTLKFEDGTSHTGTVEIFSEDEGLLSLNGRIIKWEAVCEARFHLEF